MGTEMTLQELKQLDSLKQLIERDEIILAKLASQLQPGGMNLTGMPRNPSPKNKMEEIIPLHMDTYDRLMQEKAEYEKAKNAIERYIRSVQDYQIRLILTYRFVDMMTWNQVAIKIGGKNTEDSVKKRCYRYLEKYKKF